MFPLTVVFFNVVLPFTVKFSSINTLLLGTDILPVPFALNSKSLVVNVVVIKLSSIKISPVLNLFAVIVPIELISPTVIVPLTVKSLVMRKSLDGINILPKPVARNSKLLSVSVVVIKLVSILISFLIVKNFSSNFLINTILISSAFYLFFITLRDFFIKGFKNLAQNIAHFGFSLLILSILFNSLFSSEIITNLKVGQTFENTKTKIVFESISQKEAKNYRSIIGNFTVQDSKGKIENLSPELRIYNQPNITTSEADIKTTLLSDKFIVINIVQNQEFFNVRYQVKPFMLWIWISVILISFGGLISFLKKGYEK